MRKTVMTMATLTATGLLLTACGGGADVQNAAQQSPLPSSSSVQPTTTSSSTTQPTTQPSSTQPKPSEKPKPEPKPEPKPTGEAPCTNIAAKACIDLSANKSWLLEGGKVVYGPVPITHGRKGYRTPPGSFRVFHKNRNHKSSIFNNAPMPNSVFFNGGIAFHQGSLRQTSHGCIHLSMAASQKYYSYLGYGDVVQVVP
ncbi:L,D-transpeptidase [Allokutzneria sp. A3M-2-11 16]|uniref:L,D-transpeptidase n=1 Tax=Allokutzneria sp. A3M-2-11 16 TaxID=2962043 RepID=UPI0020B6DBC4|nr:L,D-transpeptidase [Allokutzneria sp. A3M-2-11 16]MCP3798673.1 L,D-transpeptidase [Allokutzneria sp. A3M-2-11 16]